MAGTDTPISLKENQKGRCCVNSNDVKIKIPQKRKIPLFGAGFFYYKSIFCNSL